MGSERMKKIYIVDTLAALIAFGLLIVLIYYAGEFTKWLWYHWQFPRPIL